MSISRLLTAAILALSSQLAFAADNLSQAVNEKATDSLAGVVEAAAIRTGYSFFYSHPLVNTGVLGAQTLDDALVAKVVAKVENSFFPTLGVREFGGARVIITTDLAQVANSAGLRNIEAALAARQVALPAGAPVTASELNAAARALVTELSPAQFKPNFGKTVINVRTSNLAADLANLKRMGALVQEIQVKTTIPRLGGYVVGAFNIVLVGGAALDAYTAGNYAFQSQYPDAGFAWKYMNCDETAATQGTEVQYTNCEMAPNLVKQWFQNSMLAFITPIMPD